jgi:DNA-binding IclR family transcriptional regulator
VAVGATRPLFTSAAGQLLLAYQDEKWQSRYLRTVKRKPRTIVDIAQLRKKLDLIRITGLSISISEAVEGGYRRGSAHLWC